MRIYTVEAVIPEDGSIRLEALPFPKGQVVDVIVLARPDKEPGKHKQSLKGTVIKYDFPLEPVAIDDWNALQ